MSCNILACVKSNIGERDNAYTRSSLINHRYSPDEFLFHNPAALFERHVRCNGHDRFAHAIRGSQIERIEIVGYSAANNIPIGSLLTVSSTTGISPQSLTVISRATSGREVSLVQHTGFAVIISFTCIVFTSSLKSYLNSIFSPLIHAPGTEANSCETTPQRKSKLSRACLVLETSALHPEQFSIPFRNVGE
jgi:hypothetical protein